MKKVIIGFSYSSGIVPAMIRFITNSKINHTYVRIPIPEYNENMIFQASELYVNYCNYNVFIKSSTIYEEYEIEVDDDTASLGEMMRIIEVGKPYSFKEIFGLCLVLIMRGLGVDIKNPFRDGSQSFICVELSMLSIGMGKDSENTTPEEFRLWCQRNGNLIYKRID